MRHYGEPYGDSSAIPTYYVAQLTRQHVTVALNGDGGDELLAGYERHWAARIAARYDTIPRFVRHGLIRPLIPLVPEPRQRRAFLRRAKRFMTAAHLPVLDRYLHWVGAYTPAQKLVAVYRRFRRTTLGGNDSGHWLRDALAPEPHLDPVDAVLRGDTLLYLPEDLLAKVDIASMANSLEARSPLLDHRLVEFCAALPSSYKLRGRTSKWLLRRLMRDRLPPDILTRPKMGFGVPVGEWLRGELRPLLEDTLLSSRALQPRLLPPARPCARWSTTTSTRRADRTSHIWALLMLELWFREFVDAQCPRRRVARGLISFPNRLPSPSSRRCGNARPTQAELAVAVHADGPTRQLVGEELDIGIHHQRHKLGEPGRRVPPQDPRGLGRVALEMVHLRGPVIAWVDLDVLLPLQPHPIKCQLQELPDGV